MEASSISQSESIYQEFARRKRIAGRVREVSAHGEGIKVCIQCARLMANLVRQRRECGGKVKQGFHKKRARGERAAFAHAYL